MKKCILMIAGLLACACVCLAGEPTVITLTLSNIQTNTTAYSAANAAQGVASTNVYTGIGLYGYVVGVHLDFTGAASPDVDIDVKTGAGGGVVDRTILSKDDITADTLFPTMDQACNTAGTAITGQGQRIPLINDFPYLVAYDCNKTNVNVLARIYIELE